MIYKIRNKKTGRWVTGKRSFFYSDHGLKLFLGAQYYFPRRNKSAAIQAACIPSEWEIVEMVPGESRNALEFYLEKSNKLKVKDKK